MWGLKQEIRRAHGVPLPNVADNGEGGGGGGMDGEAE